MLKPNIYCVDFIPCSIGLNKINELDRRIIVQPLRKFNLNIFVKIVVFFFGKYNIVVWAQLIWWSCALDKDMIFKLRVCVIFFKNSIRYTFQYEFRILNMSVVCLYRMYKTFKKKRTIFLFVI